MLSKAVTLMQTGLPAGDSCWWAEPLLPLVKTVVLGVPRSRNVVVMLAAAVAVATFRAFVRRDRDVVTARRQAGASNVYS